MYRKMSVRSILHLNHIKLELGNLWLQLY